MIIAAALLSLALLPQAAHAEAPHAEVVVLGYNVTDRCGSTLQPGEEGNLTLSLAFLSSQEVAEYIVLEPVAPPGLRIEPAEALWGKYILPGERRDIVFNITASRALPPGNYSVALRYRIYLIDGGVVEGETNFTVPVKPCPPGGLQVDASIGPYTYPGTSGAEVTVRVRSRGGNVTNLTLTLYLPDGFRPHSRTFHVDFVAANETLRFVVRGVFIPLWIRPGNYSVRITYSYDCKVCNATALLERQVLIPFRVVEPPPLNVSLLRAGWADGYAYTGEKGALYEAVLQLLEPVRVTGLNYTVTLPPGFRAEPGTSLNGFQETSIGYGDTLQLQLRLDTPSTPGNYTGLLAGYARVEDNGTTTWRPLRFTLPMDTQPPRLQFRLLHARWASWIAGPSGYSLNARLTLLYLGNDTVRDIVLNATTTPPATIRGNTTSLVVSATPVSNTVFEVNVPGIVVPNGTREVRIVLRGIAVASTPSNGIYTTPLRLEATLPVPREEPLRLLQALTSPPHVLAGAGRVELQLRLANHGATALRLLWLNATQLPEGIRYLGTQGSCLETGLAPGDACTVTLILNVTSDASLGVQSLEVLAAYSFQTGEGLVEATRVFHIPLIVEDPWGYVQRLQLLDAHWSSATGSPRPVVAGDTAVPLLVTIYNPGPWDARGVTARLEGWNSTTATCTALAAHSSCTLTLYVDTPSEPITEPRLVLSYTVEPYGATVRASIHIPLALPLASPQEAFKISSITWGTPPTPGSRTAQLIVSLSPDPRLVSEIASAYLLLPQGLVYPQTGGKEAPLVPATETFSRAVALLAQGGAAAKQLRLLLPQVPQAGVTAGSAGTVLETTVAVTEPFSKPKEAVLVLVWRGPGGDLHTSRYPVLIPPAGSAGTLIVWSEPRSPMRGGVANFTLHVANEGTAPAYNVYLYIAPLSRTGFPVKPVIPLGRLDPGRTVTIHIPITFNPESFTGSKTYTFAALAAVVYQDAGGFQRFINATVSSILEPVVRLVLEKAKAEVKGSEVSVSGVVLNTGLETAYSARLVASCCGNETSYFIGNVEPGTETPFKISLRSRGARPGNRLKILVEYMDSYGYRYREEGYVTLLQVEAPQPHSGAAKPRASQQHAAGSMIYLGAAAAVAVSAAVLLWLRRSKGREEELSFPEEEPGEEGSAER